MYPFIVKVHYWDDIHTPAERRSTYALLYAETFSEAANKIEEYFGDILDDMKIICAGDADTLFEVSSKIAEALIIGLGNYKDGLKHIQESEEFQE